MKYYIIFNRKGKYKGFTTDRKRIKLFKKQRSSKKYMIRVLSKKNISEELSKDIHHDMNELYPIETDDGPVIAFGHEEAKWETELIEDIIKVRSHLDKLIKHAKYLELDKEEKSVIKTFLTILDNTLWDLMEDSHEPDYNQYFKLRKMLLDKLK